MVFMTELGPSLVDTTATSSFKFIHSLTNSLLGFVSCSTKGTSSCKCILDLGTVQLQRVLHTLGRLETVKSDLLSILKHLECFHKRATGTCKGVNE